MRAKPIRKGDYIQIMHQGQVFRATCTDARAGIISVAREFVPEEIGKAWFKREECKRLEGPDTPTPPRSLSYEPKGWWINLRIIKAGQHSISPSWWDMKGNQVLLSQDPPKDREGWIFASDPATELMPRNDEEE